MKITYNAGIEQFVVSELGRVLHTCPEMDDALRLAGLEPDQYDLHFLPEGEDQRSFEDLLTPIFESLEGLI